MDLIDRNFNPINLNIHYFDEHKKKRNLEYYNSYDNFGIDDDNDVVMVVVAATMLVVMMVPALVMVATVVWWRWQ